MTQLTTDQMADLAIRPFKNALVQTMGDVAYRRARGTIFYCHTHGAYAVGVASPVELAFVHRGDVNPAESNGGVDENGVPVPFVDCDIWFCTQGTMVRYEKPSYWYPR